MSLATFPSEIVRDAYNAPETPAGNFNSAWIALTRGEREQRGHFCRSRSRKNVANYSTTHQPVRRVALAKTSFPGETLIENNHQTTAKTKGTRRRRRGSPKA